MPVALTRAEQFDEHVLTALARLEGRWAEQLDDIEIVVADVPDVPDVPDSAASVPLGRAEPPRGDQPARIVVHRRSVEARARGVRARESLVHEVVVAQLAELLGLDPETVDPDGDADG